MTFPEFHRVVDAMNSRAMGCSEIKRELDDSIRSIEIGMARNARVCPCE